MIGSLLLRRSTSVYLLDFATFDPPASWRVSREQLTAADFAVRVSGLPRTPVDDALLERIEGALRTLVPWPRTAAACS